MPYEVLHNWVFGALEYAAEAGLAPHKDFAVARYRLEDDEDERIPIIEYEFGLKGKHHLVVNSFQELERLKPVLDENLGKGNYTWGTNPFGGVDADDEDWEEDEDEEVADVFPYLTMTNIQRGFNSRGTYVDSNATATIIGEMEFEFEEVAVLAGLK